MSSRFHAAHAYNAFDSAIERAESWLAGRPAKLLDFPESEVRRRIAQRLVEILLAPGINAWASSADAAQPPFAAGTVRAQGIQLDLATGEVRVSAVAFVSLFGGFFARWLRILIGMLAALGRPKGVPAPATVVTGLGAADVWVDGSDERFVRFCAQGPIRPLADARRLVVEAAPITGRPSSDQVTYSSSALLDTLRSAPISLAARAGLVLSHLMLLPRVLRDIARSSVLVIAAQDCARMPLARSLDRWGMIEAFITTNSMYIGQPLWMRQGPGRRFHTHMVWYSQNTVPVVYAVDGEHSDIPNYRHLCVDEHWVWTEGYARYLRKFDAAAIVHVVGPILWYLSEPRERTETAVGIAVFDVTPVRDEYAARLGLVKNFYAASNMIAFLADVVQACERLGAERGVPVPIVLKHKRGHSGVHDLRYIEFVDKLVAAGRIAVVPAQTNMYSLVSASAAIIAVPWSSPAYVAAALGVRAIYYDPTSELVPTFEESPLIGFASGSKALGAALGQTLHPSRPACFGAAGGRRTSMSKPTIQTARFILRPLTPDDASERYSRWLDDEQARRFIVGSRAPHDPMALRAYIAERCGRTDVLFLGIFTQDGSCHIGNIKFEPVDELAGYAVVGVLIGEPAWRRKGATVEALEASIAWLAEHRGVREVVLGVEREHVAAIHAYTRAGFAIEATSRITLDAERHVAMVRRFPGAASGV